MASNFEDYYPDHHHVKKSVLAKVKEKALKWRNLLAKRKYSNDKANETPAWGVSLDDEEEDYNNEEQDPEFHGAPMYESERTPESCKGGGAVMEQKKPPLIHRDPTKEQAMKHVDELAMHHLDEFVETSSPRSNTIKPIMHDDLDEEKSCCLAPHPTPTHDFASETRKDTLKRSASQKTLTEAVSEILVPAYNMVSDATQTIVSKIQGPDVDEEIGFKMKYDKGVSVKEFVLKKLEPGENDKAHSKVITESMSPMNSNRAEEKHVVEKFREAVSSLLGKEELRKTPIPVSTKT
ncbi:ApoC-II domain-containing protein [Dioscorea alata]|uniref:ApoC-II domain-containing protein n=3 Tax=Dioscorea alata TaxID=55571 RepID=A0ACB7V435_DIOAL|nr:ApoC-II domain-containing protein [Dioscorea alata]KAH7667936.1 ApoC-II domain-containing protein [Dioscorea alata]KAH7667937.1 ApoC-II domain-containing protein [Dioscorea alata]